MRWLRVGGPVLAALLLAVGCAHTETRVAKTEDKPRIADAARPPLGKRTRVNLSPLFDQRKDLSVYALTPDDAHELMRRVLLSPNLVFESSRSSAPEPKVLGPEPGGYLSLPNALGVAVDPDLSSALLNYLSIRHGPVVSKLIAPAFTKRFGTYGMNPDDPWWKATWVERLMLMAAQFNHEPPAGAHGEKATTRQEDWPTCGFAVRSLATGRKAFKVVAYHDAKTGEMVFKPRQSGDEPSECDANLALELPAASLEAEIVSMQDGRLLARLDETRTAPALTNSTRFEVEATRWEPDTRREYTQYRSYYEVTKLFDVVFEQRTLEKSAPVKETEYSYVASYRERQVACENAIAYFRGIANQIDQRFEESKAATLQELFKSTIDPLYGVATPHRTVAAAGGLELPPPMAEPPPPEPAPPAPESTVAPVPAPDTTATPVPAPTPEPTAPKKGGCKSNSECKGGRVCRKGVCTEP